MENLIFYRYEKYNYGVLEIELEEFICVKETKKAYWIKNKKSLHSSSKPQLIYKNAFNSYAYLSKEKALKNLKERTKKCIRISENQINTQSLFLEMIKKIEL